MPPLIVKRKDIERLLNEHKIKEEIIGDSITGRVFLTINNKTFYYRRAKLNRDYFVREILY